MSELKTLKDIVMWTCKCNSVTFDKGKCRSCGLDPDYGEIDHEELRQEAINWLKNGDLLGEENHLTPATKYWIRNFFNITADELRAAGNDERSEEAP